MKQAKIRPSVTVDSLPNSPAPKILHYKSRFSLKTRINLGKSPTKFRI